MHRITKLLIVMIALRSAAQSASVKLNMEQTEQGAQLPMQQGSSRERGPSATNQFKL